MQNSPFPQEIQLEYPFLRLPYEYSVKQFKNYRRSLENDMTQIMKKIKEMSSNQQIDSKEAEIQINIMINRLSTLKKRVNQNYQELDISNSQLRKRIQFMQSIDQNGEVKCLHEIKFNKAIVDWLMRMGHLKTAWRMTRLYELEVIPNNIIKDYAEMEYHLIQESIQILQNLKQNRTSEALKWCSANRSRLLKTDSSFEFKLILQDYIEKLRLGQTTEALNYMKRAVSSYEKPFKYFAQLQKAMGCLTFLNNPGQIQYKYYFDNERWSDLIKDFKTEMQNLYALSVDSSLEINLQAGFSSLKTIYCSMNEYQRPSICPLCNKIMESMVSKLPSTQKGESTWICRITGEIMDENNPPYLLPNNQVYSQKVNQYFNEKALQKMADKSNGKIICPKTKEEFSIADVIRVYLS